jgi:hypothetical protein
MKLRPAHRQAFDGVAEEVFVRDLTRTLRPHYPELDRVSDDALRRRVRVCVRKGRQYGLTWQSALARFTVLMFDVGPDLDDHPAFRHALEARRDDPDQDARVEHVYRSVTDAEWDGAQNASDDDQWDRLAKEVGDG